MRNPETQNTGNSSTVAERLSLLRAKELIFPYGDRASHKIPEFIFKNAILHTVTYESVLLKLRPIYHLQVAEGLIDIGGERVNEYAGRVGEHYEQAGELLKAAEWYARAGKQAQDTFEPNAAVTYYQKALEFFHGRAAPDHISQQLEIYFRFGEVLNEQARYTDAANTYSTMLGLAADHGDLIAQSRALQGLAASLIYQGDHRAALDNAVRAESFARQANHPLEIAKTLWAQGSARYRLGEPRAVLSLGEQALTISSELNNQNEMGRCLNLLGAAHYVLGEYVEAQSFWEESLEIFQSLGNRQQGMLLLSNLGALADARGDYETAFQRYNSALEIAREIGNRDGEIYILSNRGIEQVALKNHADAESDLRHVIQLTGITGAWFLANTYNYYAEALLGLGRFEEASYAALQGLAQSIEDNSPENIGGAWRALGLVAAKTGNAIKLKVRGMESSADFDARACFAQSEKIFAESEIKGERARTLREWAAYEFNMDNHDQAEKMWHEARDIYAKLGADLELKRMDRPPA